MQKPILKPLALALAVIALNTAAAGPAPTGGKVQSTKTTIKWISCPTIDTPKLRCANFSVPIDWSQPKGAQTLLGLAMVPARNQSGKIGSLFLNSGGPGGTAVNELKTTGGTGLFWFTDEIFDSFDMIAMDPRGLGASTPIQCSPDIFNERVSLFPHDEASFTAMLEHFNALGASCEKMTGPLTNHVDSVSVARDFEAVRAALGKDVKFNYIGLSYGSVFGTAYAELFPDKIRAMAFDGNTDRTQDQTYAVLTEIRGYEKVLTLFFEWCEQDQSCAMHPSHTKSTQSVASLWDALIDRAEKTPIPAPGCQGACQPNVTGEDILFNAQEFLLFKKNFPASFPLAVAVEWTSLGEALYQAIFKNDATYLSTGLMVSPVNTDAYAIPITCQDWNYTASSLPEILYLRQVALSVAPHTRGASELWRGAVECIGWPTPAPFNQRLLDITNIPPILMTNSYYDPETPYEWAVGLQSKISHSRLLTRNGVGHTSYGLRGETAAAINKYLLTLELPPPNAIYDT